MRVGHAITLVNNLVLLPGWTIRAESYENRYAGTVRLTVTVHNPDTDPANIVDGQYTGRYDITTTWAVQVDDIPEGDRTTLVYRVLEIQLEVFAHEAREGTRFGDTLDAALHPHRWETIAAHSQLSGREPGADVLYGRA